MLPQPAPARQSPRRCGVGIDTSRYGPYAAILRDDFQLLAAQRRHTRDERSEGHCEEPNVRDSDPGCARAPAFPTSWVWMGCRRGSAT